MAAKPAVKKKTAPKKRPVAKKAAPVKKSSVSPSFAGYRHHIHHTSAAGKTHVCAVKDGEIAVEICKALNKAFVGKFTHEQR